MIILVDIAEAETKVRQPYQHVHAWSEGYVRQLLLIRI